MQRVFLDTNILLDLLLERPGFEDSARILQAGEDKHIQLCCSFLTMANLAFVLRKISNTALLVPSLMQIAGLMEVLPMDNELLTESYNMKGRDFEDILQAVCASRNGCDIIVTRNAKDFKISPMDGSTTIIPQIMDPGELLSILSQPR